MRPYEVMVIFDVDLGEGDIRQRLDRVHELVRLQGGMPGEVNHWGRRTLAYEIKHRAEGYYVLLEATAEPSAMAEVDRYLALEDAVLRHKVIRQPDRVSGRTVPAGRTAPAAKGGEAPIATEAPIGGEAPIGTEAPIGAEAPIATEAPIAAEAAESSGPDVAGPTGGVPAAS